MVICRTEKSYLYNNILNSFYQNKKPPLKKAAGNQLALADDFRTLDWLKVYEHPEVALLQLRELTGQC